MRKSELTILPVATSKDARQAQRRIALNSIRLHSPISRAELVRVSGLQRNAVSVIVDELIAAMKTMLLDRGIAIILVEQHTDIALELTAEAIVLERGAVAHRAPSAQLQKDTATLERLVGLRVAATA